MRLAPALAASTLGIAVVGFDYAEGLSHLSTDPGACANGHIVQDQYDSWQKASHRTAATCAGRHLPDGFPEKYIARARNGWNHSIAFARAPD